MHEAHESEQTENKSGGNSEKEPKNISNVLINMSDFH
jgi:hypothetical protein